MTASDKQFSECEAKYARVVETFSTDPHVRLASGKGFGAGALKVDGKIFAMISSKGQFVVKLPKERVDGLVASNRASTSRPAADSR